MSNKREIGSWVQSIELLRDKDEADALVAAMVREGFPVTWAFTEKQNPAICLQYGHVASSEWQAQMGEFAKKWLSERRHRAQLDAEELEAHKKRSNEIHEFFDPTK
ncbi:MAG: hypothetical protein LAN64_14220 [Acidobacteriia bacterium]|nr:hypothetical protein [Terriglobia bacterium]